MKAIYRIAGMIAVCILMSCAGNRGSVRITYSEDQEQSRLVADYPNDVSDTVISYVAQWASHATQRSGQLPGTLKLKFLSGISCRVHAEGQSLEITADRADNNRTELAALKKEFETIQGFILAKANELR